MAWAIEVAREFDYIGYSARPVIDTCIYQVLIIHKTKFPDCIFCKKVRAPGYKDGIGIKHNKTGDNYYMCKPCWELIKSRPQEALDDAVKRFEHESDQTT